MILKKQRILFLISVFVLLLFVLFSFNLSSSEAQQKVIVINPGHSVGYDSGATGAYIDEADINQKLAGRIVKILTQQGYKVYITHTTDSSLASQKLLTQAQGSSLVNVGKATNSVNPDLALAIHHNSGGSTASGYELYWSSYRDFDTSGVYTVPNMWSDGSSARMDATPCLAATESKRLATLLHNNLNGQPNIPFRKIVERDDYLPAHATCPCVLYEGGFVSNPTEDAYLNSEQYLNEASTRIVKAINTFLGDTTFDPSTIVIEDESSPIMGNAGTNANQLEVFYNQHSSIDFPNYYKQRGVTLNQFAQMYVDECADEGVRVDVAFAQAMLETGYLKFGGSVDISQFNFAGIGATGGSNPGYDFASVYGDNANGIRMGIRAQIQHLKAYASTAALVHPCVDPRFQYVTRGSATKVNDLSLKWSVGSDYGSKITTIMAYIPTNAVQESPNNSTTTNTGSSTTPNTPTNPNTSTTPSTSTNTSNTVNPNIPENNLAGIKYIYRLYLPRTGEHLYTSDYNEAQVLSTKQNWNYEGIGWNSKTAGEPVYRLFNASTGNHLYTKDQNEVKELTAKRGWTLDNNGQALFYSNGSKPIYRLYNEKYKQHLLTTDYNEYTILPSQGWTQEGVALYAN